jgi:hypothetical protein
MFWALGVVTVVFVQRVSETNFPPKAVEARESSSALTNLYLVSFTVQTEGGAFMTGDISFASDLRSLRDVDMLRAYIARHIAGYEPKPIAQPTILNIVKL